MADRLPLSALLSQALVAFAIEFDNEFEHQTPHRTTNHGSTAASGSAPWLVSMTMWTKQPPAQKPVGWAATESRLKARGAGTLPAAS
ncbi:MAG TPA: hypothetical protein VK789_33535 [Bryobacteraceae bacterium]|nr:hypothetical protein [Bryobacteraceae bacterium]